MAKKKSKIVDRKAGKNKVRKKESSPWPWLIGAGVAALIVIPVAFNMVQSANLPGESFRSQGNTHIELGDAHPEYNSEPPTSGWHTGDLAPWGSHDFVVPDQRLIHNMEDGGVILWYPYGSPEENEEHIQILEEAVETAEETIGASLRHVVITPRENLASAYVMTAWTRMQELEAFDQDAITTFLKAFEGIDHHARGTG